MASATNTVAGLTLLNDKNLADFEVSNLLQGAPLVRSIFAQVASNGNLHKYNRQTVAAGAGFRAANAGIDNAAPQVETVTDTLTIIDASFSRDVAVAKGFKDGAEAYMEREMIYAINSAFAAIESQILNGTGSGASGFSGLADALDDTDDTMVVDATGTSGGTTISSVYLIRDAEDGVSFVLGEDGQFVVSEDLTITRILDGSSNPYNAYLATVLGWGGLQLGNAYDAARICNLTNETGKGLTDDLLAEAIALFKADAKPTKIVMNSTCQAQLQQARTATNPTGAPAPFPAEAFGIPIVVTDHLATDESIVTS